MNRKLFLKTLSVALLVIGLTACFEDDSVGPLCKKCSPKPPEPFELPFPVSKAQLMENFIEIYESRDFDDYREMLTRDYQMVLQERTISDFPQLGSTLDYDEEMRIHQRMFSGDAVVGFAGNIVPGISEITFSEFRQIDDWVPAEYQSINPEAEVGRFQVDILFSRPGFVDISVNGRIDFYVVARDSVISRNSTKYFQLAGQIDLTNSKKRAIESSMFGSVKASFD